MKCPGQDSRFWKPGSIFEIECPQCGQAVEFFKDDTTRRCNQCGSRILNPRMDFGCASYCQYAEQCLGELPPELLAQKEDLLKDRVAIEMKKYFGKDFRRIGHAESAFRGGLNSDMGRIYVRYGPPLDIQRHVSSAEYDKPYEVWNYPINGQTEFVFLDRTGDGRYVLVHSTHPDEYQNPGWKNDIQE